MTAPRDWISVAAPAETVFRGIVGPQGLAHWLADHATSEKRAGGRVYLLWNSGPQAVGRWSTYEPFCRALLDVRIDTESRPTRLTFELVEGSDATQVSATIEPESDSRAGPWSALWSHALEDLALFCESGCAGRTQRRPLLGIAFDDVSETVTRSRSLSVRHGILVTDVAADSPAGRAGLLEGDVVVSIGGHEVSDGAGVGSVLDLLEAGAIAAVVLWRGAERIEVDVTLGHRDTTSPMSSPGATWTALRTSRAADLEALRAATRDLTEDLAEHRPAEGEWSTKQVLAHLSDLERWFSDDLARVAADDPSIGWAAATLALKGTSLEAMPVGRLVERLTLDIEESLAIADRVLGGSPSASALCLVADSLTWFGEHFREHLAQIADNRTSARDTLGTLPPSGTERR